MSNFTHRMSLGDTGPAIRLNVRNDSGAAIDLSGATIAFEVFDGDGTCRTVALSAVAYVELPITTQIVRYDWGATDTTDIGAGMFRAEFIVTLSDGTVETWPTPGGTDQLWLHISP